MPINKKEFFQSKPAIDPLILHGGFYDLGVAVVVGVVADERTFPQSIKKSSSVALNFEPGNWKI